MSRFRQSHSPPISQPRPDPRINRTIPQTLRDILVMEIWVVISGTVTWEETEDYGKPKETWHRGSLGP